MGRLGFGLGFGFGTWMRTRGLTWAHDTYGHSHSHRDCLSESSGVRVHTLYMRYTYILTIYLQYMHLHNPLKYQPQYE